MHISRLRSLCIALVLILVYCFGHTQEAKRQVNITIGKHSTDVEMVAWTAYGISLGDWVNKNRIAASAPEGRFIPTFDAELHARQTQLKIWRELNEKKTYSFSYMDEMQKVEAAGFLREYIWQHHRQSTWDAPPPESRMEEFRKWQAKNLHGHVPQTGAAVNFGPPSGTVGSKI